MGDVIRLDTRRRAPAPTPAPTPTPTPAPAPVDPLWREVLGLRLRTRRQARGERLADVAARAGCSPQYLSEVERGLKDPSSEMLAALLGALGTSLGAITQGPVLRAA